MWAGTLSDPRPVDEALALVDIDGRADVAAKALSGGEKRRLDLAMALLDRPAHYLDEAQSLADQLAIMHAGRIVRAGTVADIVADHPAHISFGALDGTAAQLPPLPGATDPTTERGTTTVSCVDLQETPTELLGWRAHGVTLETLNAATASLESVFLSFADDREPAPSEPAPTAAGANHG